MLMNLKGIKLMPFYLSMGKSGSILTALLSY